MNKLYKTIHVEHNEPLEGRVVGEIPSWVKGSFYRNGPGIFEIGKEKFNHWFDGMAMLQRFNIENKKVTYQSRFLRSDAYKKNMACQKIVVGEFGTMRTAGPGESIFKRFLSRFIPTEMTDNCLISLYTLKDELYAAGEVMYIHRVDPDTLESLEKVDLSNFVAVNTTTAHPHLDNDGTLHNIGLSFKDKPKICFVKIPPKEETLDITDIHYTQVTFGNECLTESLNKPFYSWTLSEVYIRNVAKRMKPGDGFPTGEVVATIESEYRYSINYAHSFGMTENYYIFVQQPLFFNFISFFANHIRGKEFCCALKWHDNIKTRFRIINRHTGEEVHPDIHYESHPFMVFHHINAYEDNDQIVVDLCADKPESTFLEHIYMKYLTSEDCEFGIDGWGEFDARRYVLPLNTTSNVSTGNNLVTLKNTVATAVRQDNGNIFCTHEVLSETGIEFPQINYKLNTKKYKCVYGVGFHRHGPVYNTVCKIDVESKTCIEWRESHCYPSEPVFVANPDGTNEDDGVLLSAVNRTDFDEGNNAFLLVLDAKTMKEIARADFNVPRFPRDFHGLFYSNGN